LLKIIIKTISSIFAIACIALVGIYSYKYGFYVWDLNYLNEIFSGVMNPIFAFCSLLFLVVIMNLWREKIKIQITTSENQRFENTFFALLEQHNAMLSEADNENLEAFIHGLLLSSENCEDAKKQLQKSKLDEKSLKLLPENYQGSCISGLPVNQYFLVLYQILILIASSCPNSTMSRKEFTLKNFKKTRCSPEECFYSDIIRAFLTDEICYLILINCYYQDEKDTLYKFKLLIERYSLFEQLDFSHEERPDYIPDFRLLSQFETKFDKNAFVSKY
jgi:uncharacterized membrane protein